MFMNSLWIAFGGALGTLARFWLNELVSAAVGSAFPWGTVLVNISGCFVIGFFSTVTGPEGRFVLSSLSRQFVMIGICGGYTTFSAFGLQTVHMLQKGDWGIAFIHIMVSVIFCLLAVWLGIMTASSFNSFKNL